MYPRGHRSAPGRELPKKYFPSKGGHDRKSLLGLSRAYNPVKKELDIIEQMPRTSSPSKNHNHGETQNDKE